jgi:hypothetical protein
MELQTGDIILSSKKSIIARFMNWFQHDPVFWGHCSIVKDNETIWEASYILKESPVHVVIDSGPFKMIRFNGLTEEQKEIMRQEAPKLLGCPYGIFRILLQLLDHVFHTNWFTDQDDQEKLQVCSSYAAWIYDKACGYRFNDVDWESCDPDDIDDDSLLFPERWAILDERNSDLRVIRRN